MGVMTKVREQRRASVQGGGGGGSGGGGGKRASIGGSAACGARTGRMTMRAGRGSPIEPSSPPLRLETASQRARHEVITKIKQKYDELFIRLDGQHTTEGSKSSLTSRLVLKLKSDPGRLFDKNDRAIVTDTHAEEIVLLRMRAEPLSFGARFSVQLWSASLEDAMQPVLAIVNYSGLHLYSWGVEPRLLCHFGFVVEPRKRLVLGWQTFEHASDRRAGAPPVPAPTSAERVAAAAPPPADVKTVDELFLEKRSIVVHVLTPVVGGDDLGESDDGRMAYRRAKVDAPSPHPIPPSRHHDAPSHTIPPSRYRLSLTHTIPP